jgi:hypothetical protein
MKRWAQRIVVAVAMAVTVAMVADLHVVSSGASREISHFIRATPADEAEVRAAFLRFKISHKEMLSTDRIIWSRVSAPNGFTKVDIAYDAVDHREWATAAFGLVYPASLRAEINFQDGGNRGVFNKIGSGKWFMIGSPALPMCAQEFPPVVARLWGPKMFADCG